MSGPAGSLPGDWVQEGPCAALGGVQLGPASGAEGWDQAGPASGAGGWVWAVSGAGVWPQDEGDWPQDGGQVWSAGDAGESFGPAGAAGRGPEAGGAVSCGSGWVLV